MRLLPRLAPPLLALLFAACSSINVNTNYDPGAVQQLDSYKTYAWMPQPTGSDKRVYNPIVGAQVEKATDQYLQSRGYQRVDPGSNPNFLIGWHGAINEKLEADTVNSYYGYPYDPVWDPFFLGPGPVVPETYVRQYEEGTLLLDIVDASSQKLVWRGTAKSELKENADAESQQKRIYKAVSKMLKDFPPKEKKK
ncbi:DUF4136 domain-containing protein [Myxococcus sp. K15C18031901]|uniref:DUF4136 domain-containing protein n=1 Tax=Myxococcus dinghuensis TaxID=2906761 RepID=UPI0020A6F52E|nr:DUF4136 domain-containing protein [Myxococcus dinghuensis]MCP3097564.1 DUF4136 domain-containing protein [Myxococcus dinghuensis]